MKVKIGKLEIEVPDATLADAERCAAIEMREPAVGERPWDRSIELILTLCGAANPSLTPDAIKAQLPFRAVRKEGAAAGALRAVYVAAGIVDQETDTGEAPRP